MSKRVTAVGFAAALGATVLSIAAPAGPASAQAPQFVGVVTAQADPVAQAAPLNPRYPVHPSAVTTEPVNWTPQILEGKVSELDQVGDLIVVGGEFDQVAPPTGSPIQVQPNLFAFDATDGTISTTFTPSVEDEIRAVEPGPVPGTVYVGGGLDGINGQNGKLFLLNLSDGSIVPTFDDPPLNGAVNDLALVGDTLYVGGIFSTAAGQVHDGLVALDAMTGEIDPTFNINLTENHSWTEGGNFARAGVGTREFDVDPTGSTLAVVGNFRKANGLDRRQMVLIDLTGPTAEVRPDWRTQAYDPTCFSVFDSYMRDIKFSPDGEYVTVVTTGGPRPPTLCDTVARFDMADTGDDIQPVWTNYTGGDTLLSTAASGAAVYTGGHQRWMNNVSGRDNADPGSVPRPGLSGHDTENGVPLSWNPGRNPRGVGAESLLVTEAGLWVGSDTDWIGNFQRFRPRIAFFPIAGASARAPEDAASLPANIYVTDPTVVPLIGNPLYRVNAGDAELPALDGSIPWSADNGNDNVLRNSGSRTGGPNPITTVTADVPPSAPIDLFSRERWDPGAAGDGAEMEWEFPVAAGTEVDVRLYLANGCSCTNDPGERIFDVSIDGVVVLDDYDIAADVGHRVGTMKEFRIISDGVIDIDFGHVFENPLVNAIEIIEPDDDAEPPAEQELAFQRIGFDSGTVDPANLIDGPASDMDWNEVVNAFMVDDELFYITTANEFFRRTFDGENFGPVEIVDPYNDPFWSDKDSGKVVYRGTVPSFYGQIPTVAGLAFSDGRLFYTRSGNSELFVRWFVPESGVLNEPTRTVEGFDYDNVGDIFFDEAAGLLYFTDSLDGTLSSIAYADESVTGDPVAVSGPGIDGMDWRATALFVGPDLPNQPPVASATADCIGLDCTFDGSASSDADGTVDAYLWDFGDGTTSTDPAPTHTYAAAGDYTVTLTVTDDGAFSDSVELLVSVDVPNVAPVASATVDCSFLDCSFDGSASSDADGTVDAYLWDFGDGTTSTEVSPTHTYVEGTYTVTLTVTDDDGDTGVWTADVMVQAANTAPVASATADCSFLDCSFDGSASSDADGTVDAYLWDFGDGTTSTDAAPTHTYAAEGDYTVTLTVTDDDAATNSVDLSVSVEAPNVAPTAAGSLECTFLDCAFDGQASSDTDGEIVSYLWDFGDGTTSTDVAPTHAYAEGTYTVTLTVTDDEGATGVWTAELTVQAANTAPVASIEASCDRLVCSFDAAGSSDVDGTVDSYLWDFGDGTTSTEMTVDHTYAADGTYDVSLTVTDDDGATGTVTQTVTVERGNDDPVAEASISCDRLECTYDASGSTDTDGTVDGFAWTFGDGGTSDQAVGVYTYAAEGEYTVSLTVTDDDGATNTVTQLVNPMANNEPVAAIGLPSCTLLECDFSGADSSDPDGDVLSYAWDFGDGTTGVGETVTHAFAAAGTYQVTLTVADPFAASASVVREVTVSDDPVSPLEAPQAAGVESLSVWTPTPAVSVPAEVQAGDLMVLFVSSNQNPDPSDPTGVGDWVRQDRVVNGSLSVAVFTRVADGTEAGQTVTVTLPSRYRSVLTLAAYRGVAPDGIEAFATFADQGVASHTTPVVSSSGEARREVSFWADRSSSTTTWTPPADVSVLSSEIGTENGRVTTLFADRVVGAGDQGGLTATTNAASSRSVAITMLLTPAGPTPNRAPTAAIGDPSCTLLECVFSGSDSSDPDGDDLTYAWDFGDGAGDTGESVTHAFAAPGTYPVSLTVTDPFDLTSTVVRQVTVSDDPVVPLTPPQLVGVESEWIWTPTPSVTVPAGVEAGDLMVLFVSSNQNPDPSAPTGVGDWEREDRIVNGSLSVTVYTRVADGTEAGETVTVTLPSRYRTVMTLAAYRGVAADGVEAFAAVEDINLAAHTTPVVASAGESRRELSFWADRSSTTTSWAAPAEISVLSSDIGDESGRVTTLFGDRVVDAGDQGGLTATTDAASTRSVAITILLAPEPAP